MGWTDWVREVERNRDVLERILALLLALAGLADRASGLPATRRLQVICFLERGEAEARAFITGTASGSSGEAGEAAFPAADHAARLAAGFRALALVLAAILARAGRSARWLRREEIRGQFTYFPRVSAACLELAAGEISKLSPYFHLHHAARGPPPDPASQKRIKSRAAPAPRRRGFPFASRKALGRDGALGRLHIQIKISLCPVARPSPLC